MMMMILRMMILMVVKSKMNIALCSFSMTCGLDVNMILSPWFSSVISSSL